MTDELNQTCRHVSFLLLLCFSSLCFSQTGNQQDHAAQLQQAWALESAGDYHGAALAYREYLLSRPPKSAERRHVKLKLPVLQEAVSHGAGPALDLYLSAMNARAATDIDSALSLLTRLVYEYPQSTLVDDARYLHAYITMMDNFDFTSAHDQLQSLRFDFPQSRYYDTALYSEAIAQEQLGNRHLATSKLSELRDRHTGVAMAGIAWPADNTLSRLWFERSDSRLKYLQNHHKTASSLVSLEPYAEQGFSWRAVVSIDGHDMTLFLNKSEVTADTKVMGSDGAPLPHTVSTAFSGRVEGEPDSWARVTIHNNNLRGMISVHGERLRLQPEDTGGTLSDFHPLLLGDIDGNESQEQDKVLYPPKSEDNLDAYIRSIKLSAAPAFEQGTVALTALIGVVIDSKFNNYYGGRGADEAIAIINTTDGIFREQFGLALRIEPAPIVIEAKNDPMNLGSVSMETMMRNFSEYRKTNPVLSGDIAMATLFSGNKNNDSALGLAWIGSACRTDGYDVSVVSPYRMADLLSTHEIGHTLGAQHDSDTACADNSRHIMWPYLSSNTERVFSGCSKDSVQTVLANGSCFIDTLDIAVDMNIDKTMAEIYVSNYDPIRNTSGSTLAISGSVLSDLQQHPDYCHLSGATLQCTIGVVEPGDTHDIPLQFSRVLEDEDTLKATVTPIGFLDSDLNNNGMRGTLYGTEMISMNTNNFVDRPTGARPANNIEAGGVVTAVDILFLLLLLLGLSNTQCIRQRIKVCQV